MFKLCRHNNRGGYYNLVPALIFTPLYSVQPGWKLLPAAAFRHNTTAEVRSKYIFSGVRLVLKFWTFHLGIEVGR